MQIEYFCIAIRFSVGGCGSTTWYQARMNRERHRAILPFLLACAFAILLAVKYLQPQILVVIAGLDLFRGYLEALALLPVLLAALFWARMRWPLFMVGLVLCVDLVVPVASDYDANLTPTKGPTLRVITYNWLWDNQERDSIYPWLARQSADIVAIQEFSEEDRDAAEKLYALFPYHTRPAPDLVILSRHRIVQEETRLVEDHAIVRAVLDVEGRRLAVWGVHPSTLRSVSELAARNYYLTTLASMVSRAREPSVMLGDFNATQWDPYFARVKRRGQLHEEPHLLPPPTRIGVRSGLAFVGAPIDHVLTSRLNVLSNCQTGPALGSDHLPLICDLTLRD
ncbi:MAG TPA: endonuclease/exonuclease/phosphatase family protein [Ensifer sp.]|nr:endonuclease/exonuclease/phosphatase family protein [Ensifer sp.]